MADTAPYTPDRLRALAAKAYRFGVSFGVQDMREVGDYLARAAQAADEQGDILQQHEAAKAELARLQQAVAEADAARIERDTARRERDEARREAHRWKGAALSIKGERDALREELDGQRLWYHLAVDWVRELRQLIPADKQKLIDPMRAAAVAADYREALRETRAALRRARYWASLAANGGDARAQAEIDDIDRLLADDPCSTRSSPTPRSST